MKKTSISIMGLLFAMTTISAQASGLDLKNDTNADMNANRKEKREERKELRKEDQKEVSYLSQQQFYTDFGNVPVSQWRRTAAFDEATFVRDGEETTAYYDQESQLVGTTVHRSFDALPESAQKYITNKYADYSVNAVIYYDDNEANDMDMVLYGTTFEDSDMYFVDLKKDNKEIILRVDTNGSVSFFTQPG